MSTSKKQEQTAFEAMMEQNEEGLIPLAPGLTAEEMLAVYLNDDELIKAPVKVYRLNGGTNRYYYTFDEAGEPVFYTSVTTLIKFTMPTSPFLIKWIADNGHEESKNIAADRAAYGTFMHAEYANLIMFGEYDLDTLRDRLKTYIEKERLPQVFINYADDIKMDVMAFAQFLIDYDVKPLAIEIVLNHPTDGYAGALDLPCIMTIKEKGFFGEVYKSGVNKGQPKETTILKTVVALIDFKSGKKGFYEENEIQLEAYKQLWDAHFPNRPIERLYNFAPKDWRSTPTYHLKDQTDSLNRHKLQHLVNINRIEAAKRNNVVTIVEGKINLIKGLQENIKEITIGELVKQKRQKKEE